MHIKTKHPNALRGPNARLSYQTMRFPPFINPFLPAPLSGTLKIHQTIVPPTSPK